MDQTVETLIRGSRIWRVAEKPDFGIIGSNEAIISAGRAPSVGVRHLGLGREDSHRGIEEFGEMNIMVLGGPGS